MNSDLFYSKNKSIMKLTRLLILWVETALSIWRNQPVENERILTVKFLRPSFLRIACNKMLAHKWNKLHKMHMKMTPIIFIGKLRGKCGFNIYWWIIIKLYLSQPGWLSHRVGVFFKHSQKAPEPSWMLAWRLMLIKNGHQKSL